MKKKKKVLNHFSKETSGRDVSFWIHSEPGKAFDSLNQNHSTQIAIVGAGIAGITTAYLLAKAGKKVAVFEDGYVGSGETGRTTAHLVNALDDRYYDLEKYFGTEKAKLAAESHTVAVDTIDQIVNVEHIDCDFERVDGYLFLHPTDKLESLESDLKAAQEAGLTEIKFVDRIPIHSFDSGPALHYPNQAQFHPMKYLNALAEKIIDLGSEIFTSTHIDSIDKDGLTTSTGFRVSADHIVVATNTPINDRVVIHTKQAPYRTYVIALRIKKGALPHILMWDTGDQNAKPYPYHYVRLQNFDERNDLLIVGGEDHKTGQASDLENRFRNLENWTREKFPQTEEILYRWSGQIMEPIDSLAFIGRNPLDEKNIYICTGDSGNGMTHGTIAGILISDLIRGKQNPWEVVYDPSRKTLRTAPDFIEENLNVAKQYGDWLKKGDIEQIEQLAAGSGAVLKEGTKPVAAYRNESGVLSVHSAVCPHLKCIVHWNSEERSFDCPCHGSRFTGEGRVINGPANSDLEPIGEEENEKAHSEKSDSEITLI
jgi:glycine/D-amino acid oxidase-like deaminating enzyme/nitrite reductase/ring-hydroxylating ferredoxin subunit